MKFTELDLKPGLQKALGKMGYTDCTPIQEATFPHVLKGTDLLGLAETGSGKTSACGIPLVQAIDESTTNVQALVLVPTRELALQYVDEIGRLAQFTKVNSFALFGGFSMEIQKAKLNDGVHILIATPGRLIDFIYNGSISLSDVKTLVLDEADEMMNMGFIDDIHFVMSCLVQSHQTLMFSATMPSSVEKLAKQCLDHPEKVELTSQRKSPQSLDHAFCFTKHHQKVEHLVDLLKGERGQVIIFINSRHGVDKLNETLKGKVKNFDIIHGGLDQNVRTSIFGKFKSGKIEILIATDVAGRGLDFAKVTHVVNYDFPASRESYTHRTGRAGRMGRKGTAVTFFTPRELGEVKRLIESQRITPQWIGEEPDLSKTQVIRAQNKSRGKKDFNQYNRSRGANRGIRKQQGR